MFDDLLNISGMEYRPYYYNAKYWKAKTNIDVENMPEYVRVNKSGNCGLTDKAIKIINSLSLQQKINSKIVNNY